MCGPDVKGPDVWVAQHLHVQWTTLERLKPELNRQGAAALMGACPELDLGGLVVSSLACLFVLRQCLS